MKLTFRILSAYAVLIPAIIVVTLVVLFGLVFMEKLLYPQFRRTAFMNVPEKEYHIELERESALIDIIPADELPKEDKEEARGQVVDEYKRMHRDKYKKRLKQDIKAARRELGDGDYEKVWGPILKDFEE